MRVRKADQSPTEPGSAASAASHSASSSSCAPDDAGNYVQSGAVMCSHVQSGAVRCSQGRIELLRRTARLDRSQQSVAISCNQVKSGEIRCNQLQSCALLVSTAASKASRSRSEDGLDSIARRSTCGKGMAAPW